MINVNVSTIICRPVLQVFDFVSKPENDFQWQYGTLETARLSGSVNISGTFFRSIGHLMGHRNISTFEMTEYEQNKKYSIKSLSGPFHSQTSYTFETVNNCTKVNISTQTSVGNFFQINEGLVERSLRKQLKENLVMLKDLLEASHRLLAPKTIHLTNSNII